MNIIKGEDLVIFNEYFDTNLLCKVLAEKHIDLLEKRVIKGEEIPDVEKMFSIFETYTNFIKLFRN